MPGMMPWNPSEALASKTQGVGRWDKSKFPDCKMAPPYSHNPTNREFKRPKLSTDFALWSAQFRRDNHGNVTLEHAVGEFEIMVHQESLSKQAVRILQNMWTVAVDRYWSDVNVRVQYYVPPDDLEPEPDYLRIRKLTDYRHNNAGYSSNSVLERSSNKIVLIPHYAGESLSHLEYDTLVEKVFALNEAFFGKAFYIDRGEFFWVFHVIVVVDHAFESEARKTKALEQSSIDTAATVWKKIADRKDKPMDRTDPLRFMKLERVEYLKPQPQTGLLLPDCAHILHASGELGKFVDFIPKFLGSNRSNQFAWKPEAEMAWDTIIDQRLEMRYEGMQSATRLRQESNSPNVESLWRVVTEAYNTWITEKKDRPQPGSPLKLSFPRYALFHMAPNNLWLPVARPASDTNPPFISFAMFLRSHPYYSSEGVNSFAVREMKNLWHSLPWHAKDKAWAIQQTQGDAVQNYFVVSPSTPVISSAPRSNPVPATTHGATSTRETVSGTPRFGFPGNATTPNRIIAGLSTSRDRAAAKSSTCDGASARSSVARGKRAATGSTFVGDDRQTRTTNESRKVHPETSKRQRISAAAGPSSQPTVSSQAVRKATPAQLEKAKNILQSVLTFQTMAEHLTKNIIKSERFLKACK
ncbi:MAG: hypothetical protein M1836_004571 [Candelina mexicana]|nr:MAG: hypothetical protein M1836_004571 [Candelina mexicana]